MYRLLQYKMDSGVQAKAAQKRHRESRRHTLSCSKVWERAQETFLIAPIRRSVSGLARRKHLRDIYPFWLALPWVV